MYNVLNLYSVFKMTVMPLSQKLTVAGSWHTARLCSQEALSKVIEHFAAGGAVLLHDDVQRL